MSLIFCLTLGLIAGFSVLSFVEVIYWFTIRIILDKFNRISTKVFPFNEEVSVLVKTKKHVVSYMKESSIHGLGLIAGSNYLQGYST